MTGEEYVESIHDGREVYVYGERVKDVTTLRAFRNSEHSGGRSRERRLVRREIIRGGGRAPAEQGRP